MLSKPPEMPVYPQLPMPLERGLGCTVFDDQGHEYLDMYGGHAVASVGHSHPLLANAISKQANKFLFYSNAVDIKIRGQFSKHLLNACPENMRTLFLSNSGAEANENALTLARIKTGRSEIISFDGGFHGRSLLCLAISGIDNYRKLSFVNNEPLFSHAKVAKFNDIESAKNIISKSSAAVIIEPVQGLGGARVADADFLLQLKQHCKDVGAVLIFDEVQCGSGRSGSFTVAQTLGVYPDILTLAKGLGGGFPLAATLANEEISSIVGSGMLGSTFGGGPMAAASGLAVLQIIESEFLLQNTQKQSAYLFEELQKIKGVKSVSGLGLLIGIKTEMAAKALNERLLNEYSIIAGSSIYENTIRIMPPLTIKKSDIKKFIDALNKILK